MAKGISKFGRLPLEAVFGFSDSLYPVIYCSASLIVLDRNEAAYNALGDTVMGLCLDEHVSREDAANLRALIFSGTNGSDGAYVTVKLFDLKGYRYALAAYRSFMGAGYVEARMFRSIKEMLSSYDSRELIMPVKPASPEYLLKSGREGNELTASEINRVFSCNMLSNIYSMAAGRGEKPEIFDVAETVRRIVSEVSKAFAFNRSKWSVSQKGQGKFAFPVISRKNFINLLAIAVFIFSEISKDKKAAAEIIPGEDSASVEFSTVPAKSGIVFTGDFVFSLIGKMYPSTEALSSALTYICALYGIGCYSGVKENGELFLRLVLSKEEIRIDYSVKHRKVFDMKGMRESIALIGFMTDR